MSDKYKVGGWHEDFEDEVRPLEVTAAELEVQALRLEIAQCPKCPEDDLCNLCRGKTARIMELTGRGDE